MALSGSLRTLSLPEIFQTLGRSTATGVLRLTSAEGRVDVVFDAGVVRDLVHRERDRNWTLIERLVAMDVLPTTVLNGAQSGNQGTLQSLIVAGELTDQEANEALHDHTFDELCNLFTWDNANFVFIESDGEAGGEDASVVDELEAARALNLAIDVSTLLMESARRLDEWHQILPDLPSDDVVIDVVAGRDLEREERFGDYPARAILQKVDGVRTIEELVAATPITRMDVHSVIFDAMCEGVLEVIPVEEMERRAVALSDEGDHARAALLLRACLRLETGRASAMGHLAQALERLGDTAEASGCMAQLALGYLHDGHQEQAVAAARRAADLSSDSSQQIVLVRCLLESGDTAGAVVELIRIARHLVEQTRHEEARGTLHKVLQLDPGNEDARHELAQLCGEEDQQDSSVAVCIECGASNERGKIACDVCGAALHLTCRNCQRAVSISDRICIFCGANPHRAPDAEGDGLQGPSTTALIRKDDHDPDRRETLHARMATARQAEQEERYAEALAIWKDLHAGQSGNHRLQRHIRQLEGLVHDREVESLIERGHTLRQRRRYLGALRSYRRAQRAIAADDPRRSRLRELILATQRSNRITAMVYAVALVLLSVVAFLVVEPIYRLRGYLHRLDAVEARLDTRIQEADAPADYRGIAALLDPKLEDEAAAIGEEAQAAYQRLAARVEAQRMRLGTQALRDIEAHIDAGEWEAAIDAIDAFSAVFGDGVDRERRRHLEALIAERRQLQERAPERLAEIVAAVAEGRRQGLREELTTLVPLLAAEARGRAERLLADLAAEERSVREALDRAEALHATDLAAAAAVLAQTRDRAAAWGWDERWASLHATVSSAREAAAAAFDDLGENAGQDRLAAFIAEHPASARIEAVRRRLSEVRAREEARRAEIERLLTTYAEAREDGRWEDCWRLARRLWAEVPEVATEHSVLVPLRIATGVAGSELVVEGGTVATAGEDGALTWWYERRLPEVLHLRAEGFDRVALDRDALAETWQTTIRFDRSLAWELALEAPVHELVAWRGGFLAVAGADLVRIDAAGELLWRRRVGRDGPAVDRRARGWRRPAVTDEAVLAPLAGGGMLLLGPDGAVLAEVDGPTVDRRPVLYRNELLGDEIRIACVADELYRGPLEGDLESVGIAALSGPVVHAHGVDRRLLVGTLDGRLLAVDDHRGARAWELDLQATDIGPLQALGDDRVLTVLDGSRLAMLGIAGDGARILWEYAVDGALRMPPFVHRDEVLVTAGDTIQAVDPDRGTSQPRVRLPAVATTAAVAYADTVIASSRAASGATLLAYRGGRLAWRRELTHSVTVIVADPRQVVVGLADGRILGLQP